MRLTNDDDVVTFLCIQLFFVLFLWLFFVAICIFIMYDFVSNSIISLL